MLVGILNQEQKELIVNQEFDTDSYFNPIQDINDNWIISQEEMNMCVNPNFEWIKDIEMIDYQPKIISDLF